MTAQECDGKGKPGWKKPLRPSLPGYNLLFTYRFASMAIQITCPNCDALLNAPEGVIGRRVKCKKCGEPFVARDEPRAARTPSPPPAHDDADEVPPRRSRRTEDSDPPRRSSTRDEDDDRFRYRDDDDEDRSTGRRKGGRKKKKSKVLLYVLLGLGGLFLLCGGACGIGIYSLISEGTPREYKSPDGVFTASFPGSPTRKSEGLNKTGYTLDFILTAYVVYVEGLDAQKFGGALTDADTKLIFATMEQSFTLKGKQQVVRKTPIVHQGFQGLEIEATDTDGIKYIMRMFISSKNMIAIVYGAKNSRFDNARATKFFESLKIHDPPPAKVKF